MIYEVVDLPKVCGIERRTITSTEVARIITREKKSIQGIVVNVNQSKMIVENIAMIGLMTFL